MSRLFIYSSILCFLAICIGGCERDRNGDPIELYIVNNSDDTVIAALQYNFPDTTLENFKETAARDASTIPPDLEERFFEFAGWERKISNSDSEGILTVIIYDAKVVRSLPWERIESEYKILKKYHLTLNELKGSNWKVEYQ